MAARGWKTAGQGRLEGLLLGGEMLGTTQKR